MTEAIRAAGADGDSVGGVLETAILGLPAGVGEPYFDSVESLLSHMAFAMPAVKGIEFGAGFGFAGLRGSEANDPFRMGPQGQDLHCRQPQCGDQRRHCQRDAGGVPHRR